MENQKEILAAYLAEALAEKGLSLDQETLNLMDRCVQLVPRPLSEHEEARSITQTKDSSGKHSATSFKLANIAQLETEDIIKILGISTGILMDGDKAQKIIYAFVMLLIDFYPKLKIKFSDQEAQVIYALSKLQEKTFTTSQVAASYQAIFKNELTLEQLEASLDVLEESDVLKRTALETYQLRERIKNLVRK